MTLQQIINANMYLHGWYLSLWGHGVDYVTRGRLEGIRLRNAAVLEERRRLALARGAVVSLTLDREGCWHVISGGDP